MRERNYEWNISRLKWQEYATFKRQGDNKELANFRLRVTRFKVLAEVINQKARWCLDG